VRQPRLFSGCMRWSCRPHRSGNSCRIPLGRVVMGDKRHQEDPATTRSAPIVVLSADTSLSTPAALTTD
jgi:hypothetical protein